MAYEATQWANGQTITVAGLNKLEQAVGEMNMSYSPHTWTDGEALTASKMNALEQAVASGGGSSDFSTAEVTFINNTDNYPDFGGAFAMDGEDGDLDLTYPTVNPEPNTTSTYNLILYQGVGVISILNDNISISITGAIEGSSPEWLVRGDCTMTIRQML